MIITENYIFDIVESLNRSLHIVNSIEDQVLIPRTWD